jgi:hypothetical protein
MTNHYYENATHGYMRYENDRYAQFIFSMIPQSWSADAEAVEIGAGMGRFSTPLVDTFRTVHLIEPCAPYVEELKKKYGNCSNVSVHEVDALSFLTTHQFKTAPVIFLFHVLHHMSYQQRQELYAFVRNQKGTCIFVEPNPINPLLLIQLAVTPSMKWEEEKQYLLLGRRRYQKEATENQISLSYHKRVSLFPPFFANAALSKFERFPLSLFEPFTTFFPFLASYQIGVLRG